MNDMFRTEERALSNKKKLRPHQAKAIDMIRSLLGQGLRRVVCQGPCGFGKTLVASKIIEMALAKGNRVIFTAPAISLIDQTVEAFEAEGITGIGVMQAKHPRTDAMARVQIASVQTLARRDIPQAALMVIDECHLRAKIVEQLMDTRPDVFFIGLSATPWATGMGLRWQGLAIPITMQELIDQGFLSKFTAYAPDVPDLKGVRTIGGDYAEDQLAQVMGDAKLVGSVVETWLAQGENRPTLCFAVNRAHAALLQAQFERAGVASGYVDANTDLVERRLINRRFRAGDIKVICSVRTMTTGVDLPVSCIIDAAPTKSRILHIQKLGRGLRVNPGSEDLKILDHAGNSLRLGLVTDIHQETLNATPPGKKRPEERTAKLPSPCVVCGVVHTGLICPGCGRERKAVSRVESAAGQLVEITGKAKAPTMAEKQQWYSMLLTVRRDRGRSSGWLAHTYRERFGVWPRGMDDVMLPPSADVWNYVKSKDIRFAKRRDTDVSYQNHSGG